jgi:hypothetical protein
MAQHLYREELDADQAREAAIAALIALSIPAQILCKKAGVPTKVGDGARQLVNLNTCWCSSPHTIPSDANNPDALRMRIQSDHVLCPFHGKKFSVYALLDILPLSDAA